jgi:hypothetical protein
MWMSFAALGSACEFNAYQAHYRQHGQNMSSAYKALKEVKQHRAAFDALFNRYGLRLPDAARLRKIANEVAGRDAFWAANEAFDRGERMLCEESLAFALETDPSLKDSKQYRRMQLKRTVGHGTWSVLQAAGKLLRPTSKAS